MNDTKKLTSTVQHVTRHLNPVKTNKQTNKTVTILNSQRTKVDVYAKLTYRIPVVFWDVAVFIFFPAIIFPKIKLNLRIACANINRLLKH